MTLPHLIKILDILVKNYMLTDDFHKMKLKFLCQHVQSGCEGFLTIAYQLQVLLCIMREGQPHFPVFLCGHSQRSEANT